MREILVVVGIALTFIGYIPYIQDTIKDKTHPHVYTWFSWSLLSFLIFALQIADGAGIGAYITLTSGMATSIIFLLGLRQANKNITFTDTIVFAGVIVGTLAWLLADKPLTSTVLLVSIDVAAFIPTIRKSWKTPRSETLVSYLVNIARHGLGVITLKQFTPITVLFPGTWTIVNLLFVCMLCIRRHIVRVPQTTHVNKYK